VRLNVVYGNRYAPGVLEGVLDHLLCSVVEHGAGFGLANSIHQTKYSCMEKRIKFACQSKKYLKFEIYPLKIDTIKTITQNIFTTAT
jgi:hypothetical protein